MSNQLAGADRMKRASVRIDEALLDDFDDAVDGSTRWESRSDAIRDFIETVVDNPDVEESDGRVPPADDDLADAYEMLRSVSVDGRWIPEERALALLAQHQSTSKDMARQTLIVPLVELGYLGRSSDMRGYTAIKVRE
jgi:Arc/MetJ-type ribon-helix-helix transcriptional regulator